jgi:zinc protease
MTVTLSKVTAASARGGATQRFDLEGGTAVLLEESHALPLLSLTIAFRSGAAHDPIGKEGTLRMAGRMLRRGCEGMTASATEDAIDRLGAELSVDISSSSISLQAQVIARSVDAFVDLLAQLLGSPQFPLDEFERLRRESVAELIEMRDNDQTLAAQAFRRSLFAGHLYGRSALGTTASLAALTIDDVRAAYAKHFVRGNAIIGFAGDIEATRAPQLAARLVAGLPLGGPVPDPVRPPPSPKGRRLVVVDKPERTQTQILIGTLGTWPHDDDHIALSIANAVLGGSFTSRLMREVRSKRGWSYGASARLAIDRQRQAFWMLTFPAATDAAPCIALEVQLLEQLVANGLSAKELAFIKRFLVRSHAFDIDTPAKRLGLELEVEVLGLPADYYSAYIPHVEAVTLEQANLAAKARLSVDDLLIVVVGTASQILDDVRAAVPRLAEHEVLPFDTE